MSECVVRMEMPKSCEGCWMPSRRCKWRTLSWYLKDDSTVSYRNSRSPFCPIICSLPEGHGRLVDADAAINDIKYEILEYKMDGMKGTPIPTEHLWLMKNWIADEDICPTIVPAERSKTCLD